LSDFPTIFVDKSDNMVEIQEQIVEDAILKELDKLKGMSTVEPDAVINTDCKPGAIGFRSQVLVTLMGQLEEVLEITIPNNCYIFRDSDGNRELSVKEATQKLIKIAKYAK
jgi:hypothetical protein